MGEGRSSKQVLETPIETVNFPIYDLLTDSSQHYYLQTHYEG